jgi:hypothetical protein
MIRKSSQWLAALLLSAAFVSPVGAAPPFPPFQCPWFPARECDRSDYCCLHYITPSVYKFWAYHTPPRYVYGGPVNGVLAYRIDRYPCRDAYPTELSQKYIEVGRERAQKPEASASSPPQK